MKKFIITEKFVGYADIERLNQFQKNQSSEEAI